MKDTVEIFEHEYLGELTTVVHKEETMFIANEVALMLGYSNKAKAVQNHIDAEDKLLITNKNPIMGLPTPDRGLYLINESGLYSLILRSKLPQAKVFKRWVTSEVLPSIRKHGGYIAGQEDMTPEELMAKAVIMAQSKIDELNSLVKEKDSIISDKNFPISLTRMFSGNNKVAQAANLYMEDKGWIKKSFDKGVKKGWVLTESGENVSYGVQHGKHSIFWTPAILDLLPSQKELLEFAERMNLYNYKEC